MDQFVMVYYDVVPKCEKVVRVCISTRFALREWYKVIEQVKKSRQEGDTHIIGGAFLRCLIFCRFA